MKRLLVFLLAALAAFFGAYAASDPRMFFGGGGPAPAAGQSERPAVEAALDRLDAAMARYFDSGDEVPARAVLAAPDDPGSPLQEWRLDRSDWQARGEVPATTLVQRKLLAVSLADLDTVSATAAEEWETRFGAATPVRATFTTQYVLRRGPAGLRVSSVVVSP